MRGKTIGTFLGAGLVGSAVLEAASSLLRALAPVAPRLDLLGEDTVSRLYRAAGARPPPLERRRHLAFAGSLLVDGALLGLVTRGNPRMPWARGLSIGGLMALAATRLPPLLGVARGTSRSSRAPRGTPWLTLGLYAIGGLAAAMVTRALARRGDRRVLNEAKQRAINVVRASERAVN